MGKAGARLTTGTGGPRKVYWGAVGSTTTVQQPGSRVKGEAGDEGKGSTKKNNYKNI